MPELVGQVLAAGVYGLLIGAFYALIALGVVLIFRSTRTVNFAHGHFAILGAFIYLQLVVLGGRSVVGGLLAAGLVVAMAGLLWGQVARRMQRRGDDLVPLVGSLGVFIALDGVIVRIWGGNQPYRVPSFLPRPTLMIGGAAVDPVLLWIGLATVLVSLALVVFFRTTDLGLRMRAAVQNPEAAELIGISTERLASYAWVVGSFLGFAGLMLYVPRSYLENTTMLGVLIRAFAASSVGGFESFEGAVLGALALGVAEALAGRFIGSALQSIVALTLVAVMIFISPRGVFVVRGERR